MPGSHSSFFGKIQQGVSGTIRKGQKAVAKHQKASHKRLMTRLDRQKAAAEAELATAEAQLAVSQLQLRASQAKRQATRTRQQAGHFTPTERVAGTLQSVGRQGAAFARGFIQEGRKQSGSSRKRR